MKQLGGRQGVLSGVRPAGRGKAAGAGVSPPAEPLSDSSLAGDRSIFSRSLATLNDVYPPAMQ